MTHMIETLNRADGSVDGHAAGCKDIARIAKLERIDRYGAIEVDTKHDAWLDYNADFLNEGSGAYSIHWLACANHVPQGLADDEETWDQEPDETVEPTTTTTKESKMTTTKPSTPNTRTYDTASKALRIKALGVDCTIPYCSATAGFPCVSAKGKPVDPHTRRVQRALAMEKAAAKKAAKAAADPKAASKAAAKPATKKASTKKASPSPTGDHRSQELVDALAQVAAELEPAAVCKPCQGRHHKQCKGTPEAPCGCSSKVHADEAL